jgi:quinol monooxygenase YgiN
MFTAIAAVKIKPGMRDEWIRLIEPNARGAAAESGCLGFHLMADREDENTVWFVEMYKSEQDFKDHQQTKHFLDWMPHLERMIDSVVPNTAAFADGIYPPANGWD